MAPAHLQLAWRLALPPLLFLAAGTGASSPPAPAPARAARAGSSQQWARVPLETGGLVTAPCPDGITTAAVACKLTPEASVTMDADGKQIFAAANMVAGNQCTCNAPPVDAASAAALLFSQDNNTFVKSGVSIDYFALFSPSLGKRPYLSTDTKGTFVMLVDTAAGSGLQLSCPEVGLDKVPIAAGGGPVAVEFSLAKLPPVFDGFLNLTLSGSGNAPLVVKSLRMMRVPAPAAAIRDSFSWLDYSRKSIMVGAKPFVPVGFYSAACGIGGPRGAAPSFEGMLADLEAQAKQGINVVMQYQASGVTNSTRLDGARAHCCRQLLFSLPPAELSASA